MSVIGTLAELSFVSLFEENSLTAPLILPLPIFVRHHVHSREKCCLSQPLNCS
jgi:hypothetical protein